MHRLWRASRLRPALDLLEIMSKKCKFDSGAVGSTGFCTGKESRSGIKNETGSDETGFKYLNAPEKSPADKKEYSVIRLDNGLTALLITDHPVVDLKENETEAEAASAESSSGSDEEEDAEGSEASEAEDTDQKISACALCVGVGSFSDPPEIPGLAHFLEHMVFMGSEKYPAENEFDAFIKRKGGSDNASTQCENTTFYFECQEEHLREAMDIFSQFFISPLMKYDAMARERQAIESEFNMALSSDSYRRSQLLCSFAKKENPAGKFMWGNVKTLKDNVEDKKLFDSLHEFRRRHYSAHRMTLAVQARLPQHVLATWVRDSFSKVKNNMLEPDKFLLLEEPFNMAEINKIYYLEPVNDICEVEISWALPSLQHLYKKKPMEYASWLVGHEGKGGLLNWLRKKVWALGIVAGEVEDTGATSLLSLFSLRIELSEEGYKNIEQVLEATFSYIKLLQDTGPVERIFNEMKKVSDNNFRYYEEISPVENVENIVENMQLYPPEHYITGPELYLEFDPVEIKRVLDALTPDKVNIMISSKKMNKELTLDKVEPWFKTKYTCEEIPNSWKEAWKLGAKAEEFHLPEPNVYIPDDFSLLPTNIEHANDKYPRKITSSDILELWYKEDNKFMLPQAYMYFYLISPEHAAGPLQRTMVDMYMAALGQLLTEEAYPAIVTEMGYTIACVERGMVLNVYGFNQKLHLLLETIQEGILNFRTGLTKELFEAVKKLQHRYYTNLNLKAGMLAKDLRMATTLDTFWPVTERLKVLPDITQESLVEFSEKYFESMYIQGLIQGNISEARAREIGEGFAEKLVKRPLTIKPEVRVCKLEEGQLNVRAMSFNLEDTNCVSTMYFQVGPGSIRDYCVLELLLTLIEEPLFDTLRTQEQLGYDVSCRLRDTYGILGFTITVVSQRNKVTVEHVEERIKAFLEASLKKFKTIKPEDFEEAVVAMVKLKQYSDVHLKEEVSRNWGEIKNSEFVFNRLEIEVGHLQNIEAQEVYSSLENVLGPRGRVLLLQVVSDRESATDLTNPTTIQFLPPKVGKAGQVYITDPVAYKKQLYVYPVSKVDK